MGGPKEDEEYYRLLFLLLPLKREKEKTKDYQKGDVRSITFLHVAPNLLSSSYAAIVHSELETFYHRVDL